MEPRNRFQGMNSAGLCSLAGRYDNPIPTRYLAPIDCLQIPALVVDWFILYMILLVWWPWNNDIYDNRDEHAMVVTITIHNASCHSRSVSAFGEIHPECLRAATIPILNQGLCQNMYSSFSQNVLDSKYCTSTKESTRTCSHPSVRMCYIESTVP